MILSPRFSGKIHGDRMSRYDEKHWKGLQMTHEEMLYYKYMYHDVQIHNLNEFVNELKKKRPDLIPCVRLVNAHKRHLYPYIIIFNPNTIIEYAWLIRYEVDEFNMSYLKVDGAKNAATVSYQSAGYVQWTAADAVDTFLHNLQMHPLDVSQQALPSSKKVMHSQLLPLLLPIPDAGALTLYQKKHPPASDGLPSSQKRLQLPASDSVKLEESLSSLERRLQTVTDWIQKRKTDKIVDINNGSFETILDRLDDYMKRIEHLEHITGSDDQVHGMSYDPFSMMVKKAPSSSART